jgi:hypothetical protein
MTGTFVSDLKGQSSDIEPIEQHSPSQCLQPQLL